MVTLVFLGIPWGCRTTEPNKDESQLRTDETRKVLFDFCKMHEAEESLEEITNSICRCVEGKPNSEISLEEKDLACGPEGTVQSWIDDVRYTLSMEGQAAITDTAQSKLSAKDHQCLQQLVDFNLELYADTLLRTCKDQSTKSFLSMLRRPDSSEPQKCWRLLRVSEDGCFLASPCKGSGSSELGALPILSQDLGSTLVDEGKTVKLCHANIQKIHALKDPDNAEGEYNLSFANFLTFGRSAPNVSFRPANCHGTAQAVIGGFLDKTPITAIDFHGPHVKEECGTAGAKIFETRKGSNQTTAGDFPIELGGHVINMNHDASCSAEDCGTASFFVAECGDPMIAYAFHEGMCINCWEKQLNDHGLSKVPVDGDWRDLVPGCVLTTSDHSVAIVMENQGYCYYYEATTPYGPPLLRVDTCPMVYKKFDRKWCPKESMIFSLSGF
jgi:hypothetical protein